MTPLARRVRSLEPGPGVLFRPTAYGRAGIAAFLRDVIALGNQPLNGPRYIVVGIEYDGARRVYKSISDSDFSVPSPYAAALNEFIEPVLRLRHEAVHVEDQRVGIFEISGCHDQPYMMRIDYSRDLRRGDAFVLVNGVPVKLGRSQLQRLFEKRFKDSVSADKIEVGFEGDVLLKNLELPTIDLAELPSVVARSKFRKLVEAMAEARGTGSTSIVARLTHARLFGAESPYQDRTTDELVRDMRRTADTYREDDLHFLFEERANRLGIVILNQGSEALKNASLSLAIPCHEALFIATVLPPQRLDGRLVERGSLEAERYPSVTARSNGVYVTAALGDIPGGAQLSAFELPLRIAAGSALAGRRVGIRYTLSAANLRIPATGRLRLLF